MTPNELLVSAIAVNLAAAPIALVVSRWRFLAGVVAFLATAVSSDLAIWAAVKVLGGGPGEALTLWSIPSLGSAFRFQVDGLSAIFLILIAAIAVLAALYSIAYMKHYKELGVGRYYPHFLLFAAGMYGIVTVTDLMGAFFAFWQLMTIPSFALVRFERNKPENVRAAWRYLILMEISCVLVMLGAGVLGKFMPAAGEASGLVRFDFDRLSEAMPALLENHGGIAALVLLLFLVGFGIKAGMWPFGQLWLPDAHPAAPSPVSALLSGVMIKTGVYGILRSFLWLVPVEALASYPARTWGLVIAALGTITLFIGTLQALKQEESKRLLAFHSIGQVGYILLGIGACLSLIGPGAPEIRALAAMGLYGALFHTLNHGLFKGLLFLNAGSMLYATGTQDLNRLGGLVRFMPVTAATALVASFSIAGVPLFNGFGSKWSIYVSTILGSREAGLLAIFGVFAILTSALTLASFMKFFGSSFLSRPSRLVEDSARAGRLEVGALMGAPQLVLAFLCVLLGVLPALALNMIRAGIEGSPGGLGEVLALAAAPNVDAAGVSAAGGSALLGPLAVVAALAGLMLLAWWISRAGGATRRAAEPWLCGYQPESEATRYGAHNLYIEFKRYFGWVGGMKNHRPRAAETTAAGSREPERH
jgi:hydrogenase-4 component B